MKQIDKDLGQTYSDMYGGEMPTSIGPPNSETKRYPSFHYEGSHELPIPKKGTMTVEYEIVSSTESTNREGKEHYACTVEIRRIVSASGSEPSSPASSGSDAEAALDKLRDMLEEHEEDEGQD